jgi:hypothetical protein
MRALDQLIVGRTVIVISHRLSTLGNVDEILVLKEGQIVERGSYQELRRKGGVFAMLLEEQNRYNIEKVGDKSILRSAFVPLQVGAYGAQGTPAPITPLPPVAPVLAGSSPLAPQAIEMRQTPVERVPGTNGGPRPVQEQRPPTARILVEVDGKTVGQYVLSKPIMTIGRLSSNDIHVPSQRVSRLHAKIRSAHGSWITEDAESLNGLVYQGQRVDHIVLNPGDRIFVAPSAVLQYQMA